MITITLSSSGKPSNDRAIAFAKALAASKKQMQKEMQEYYDENKEEIQAKLKSIK
jgi:phosphoribosylcarboxyaminoimidazole (NCAIR) mutase